MALTPAERAAARVGWLTRIRADIKRRSNVKLVIAGGDPRRRLFDKLDEMRTRLQNDPNYVEPTPAESRRAAGKVESWLKKRGYLRNSE